MGKYLARGHSVWTERSEVHTRWPRAKYFPIQPDLTQSISILSYDHRAFPLFFYFFIISIFFFSENKICYRNVHLRCSFWQKSWDLNSNKVSSHLARSRTLFLAGPYVILPGPDGFFRPCSRHRVRPSCGDFLNSFAMKVCAGPYGSYDKIIIIVPKTMTKLITKADLHQDDRNTTSV